MDNDNRPIYCLSSSIAHALNMENEVNLLYSNDILFILHSVYYVFVGKYLLNMII